MRGSLPLSPRRHEPGRELENTAVQVPQKQFSMETRMFTLQIKVGRGGGARPRDTD